MFSKMLLPPYVTEKLRCTQCRQYLSTHPVKVYPDCHIRCLRCSFKYDKGVPSVLYQKVIEHFQFPCVHAQNGCEELLSTFQSTNHEVKCKGGEAGCPRPKNKPVVEGYVCAVCAHQRHSSVDMIGHIKHTHVNTILSVAAFSFVHDEGSLRFYKVHFTGKYLVTLFVDWDQATDKFAVFPVCPAQTRRRNITYTVSLYDIDDNLREELATITCGKVLPIRSSEFTKTEIPPYTYPRGVTIVKFEVKDTPVLILPDPIDHLNYPGPRAVILWEPNISRLVNFLEMMSPAYYVGGAPWRIVLRRRPKAEPSQLGVYLQCDQNFDGNTQLKYTVLYHCSLISSFPGKTFVDRSKSRDEFKATFPITGSMDFMLWDKFVDPNNGFVNNGRIKFELDIDVRIKQF